MIRLAKYMKPFTGLIMAAIVFIGVQAMADLSLPDYMSNIVNIGIQQNGIEDAALEKMRESTWENWKMFMTQEEQENIEEKYTLENNLLVLQKVTKEERGKISNTLGKAMIATAGVAMLQEKLNVENVQMNGSTIQAGTDIMMLLERMPEEQRLLVKEQMTKQIEAMGEGAIIQGATAAIKKEYEAIGMDTDAMQAKYILKEGGIMLGIALISAMAIVLIGFFASRISAGFARDLRSAVFAKVEGFSKAELDKFSTASLITRTTNDITQISNLIVIMIRMIFYAPILGVGGVIKALSRNASMSWIIAVAVVALLTVVIVVYFIAVPKFKIIQKLVDKLNLVARENLAGILVIRAFNTQKFEENRFDKANDDIAKTTLFVNRVMISVFPTMIFIMNAITLLIVWIGANEIANSSMQVGDMMAYMQYAMQIIFAFIMMSFMFILIPRASVASGRVADVLETDFSIQDPETSADFQQEQKGKIEFKNVSFKYEGAQENMLKNISFVAKPGETTAIIGTTGSGKTSLVNLIPRFYDVSEGELFINGQDVRKVKQEDLRNQIGFVPQKSILLSGTIGSNLEYAKEGARKNELEKAASVAQAKEFIMEKADGFGAEISQGGSNVSGGQKQRIAIARALMKKDADIFIFDDSFSALDFKTDAKLRKALHDEMKGKTLLIVAQRVATIMNAEQILVLEEGRIVGKGTHNELLKNCEVYQEIAYSQLSKEELA